MIKSVVVLAAIVAVLTTALVSAKRPKWHELESRNYNFEQYISDFGKDYKRGSSEYKNRNALFDIELKDVMEHNKQGHSWKKGVNDFSDWTHEEKSSRLFGYDHKMKQVYDAKPASEKSELEPIRATGRPLPQKVDWTLAVPAIGTAVKDQGRCGSCWTFASSESMENAWAQATGQLFALSQQQVASCTHNPDDCGGTGGCGGGIAELAIDSVAFADGIVSEWQYPYTSYFGKNAMCSYWKNLTFVKMAGYSKVQPLNDQGAFLDALSQGPLAVSVDASHWSSYESGVFSGCANADGTWKNISMDHAVQAVGYDIENGYIKIRNSWSPSWGELGYLRITLTDICGWNVHPQNGYGCKGDTAPQRVCGMCGVYSDGLWAVAQTEGPGRKNKKN